LAKYDADNQKERKLKEKEIPAIQTAEEMKIRKIIRDNDEKLNQQDNERK